MRLSCPTCQTEYDVPDAALLGRTRKLRCVNCGNQWEAGPIGMPESAPQPVAAPAPAPTAAELEYINRPRAPAPAGVGYGAAGIDERDFGRDGPAPPPPSPVDLPPRPDPAEARHQADRESFAALLEASRQAGSQNLEVTTTHQGKAGRKSLSPWLISLLVLLLAVALVFLEREQLMALWPPSIRFFDALGLK